MQCVIRGSQVILRYNLTISGFFYYGPWFPSYQGTGLANRGDSKYILLLSLRDHYMPAPAIVEFPVENACRRCPI